MGEVAAGFTLAIRRALLMPRTRIFTGEPSFTIGVLAHTVTAGALLELISSDRCDPKDADIVTERMTACVRRPAVLRGLR